MPTFVSQCTRYLALNCSWVQTVSGPCLAQVSLTNYHGTVLFDSYCLPSSVVMDYRTPITGVDVRDLTSGNVFLFLPFHMLTYVIIASAQPLHSLQPQLTQLIQGKILVGYCLWVDLSVSCLRQMLFVC